MMPRYLVTMPVTGFVSKEVEADDEDAAIHVFWDSGASPSEPDAWQFTEHVVRGNASTALQNDVQVRELCDIGLDIEAPITIRVSPWAGAREPAAGKGTALGVAGS